jgi:hypothetical protein
MTLLSLYCPGIQFELQYTFISIKNNLIDYIKENLIFFYYHFF